MVSLLSQLFLIASIFPITIVLSHPSCSLKITYMSHGFVFLCLLAYLMSTEFILVVASDKILFLFKAKPHTMVVVSFPIALIRFDKSNFREKGYIWIHSSRVKFILTGKAAAAAAGV